MSYVRFTPVLGIFIPGDGSSFLKVDKVLILLVSGHLNRHSRSS